MAVLLQAIEAVCAALDGNGEAAQALDGIASLVDKSLLQQTEQEGEEPRFMMLETIREYGLERLTVNGEMEAARQAHAEYYLWLLEERLSRNFGVQGKSGGCSDWIKSMGTCGQHLGGS